jgi:hypothetical protein
MLARFRHHHIIATQQDHIIRLQQMVSNQHPWQRRPTAAGRKQPLDRPITSPFARPSP